MSAHVAQPGAGELFIADDVRIFIAETAAPRGAPMTDRPNARVTDLEPLSLSPLEAGRLLGVSASHITDLAKEGILRARKSRARVLIDYQDVWPTTSPCRTRTCDKTKAPTRGG
jgi:excisionase family DNA binding protein